MTSNDFSERLAAFYTLERKGIKLGLQHTYELLDLLNNPHKDLIMIHVAGTNGKGSTCAILEAVLRLMGLNVGLYTSPHLINFNERIRINGEQISNQRIVQFFDYATEFINKINSTFFEATTCMAFDYFKQNNVDIVIVETGLGGRLDSTNVIMPVLTIITSISMDHMNILGLDLKSIAKEKAGIIKKEIPVIVSHQKEEVNQILFEKAKKQNSPVINLKPISEIIISEQGTNFNYENNLFSTSLIGEHQAQNAALCIEALKLIKPNITDNMIRKGLSSVIWPGRMHKIANGLYYDVAHNESGVQYLLDTLKKIYPNKELVGLLGMKGDKDLRWLSNIVSSQFLKLYITTDQEKLLLNEQELSNNLDDFGLRQQVVNSVADGISKLQNYIDDGCIGIIFGSHYFAKEIFQNFEIPFDSIHN
mgnify:FL=1